MVRIVRSCMQSILKILNSLLGMVGIAVILYSIWIIRKWEEQTGDSPFGDTDHAAPWFIYAFLGLGAILCVVTCAGHIAAETANGCWLYLYMAFVFFLILLEGAVVADIFLNRDWEEVFPEDPSGGFNKIKDFIKTNFEICKWIGLSIVCVQGLSFLLAMILKALGPHRYYDSDDEFDVRRAPLLYSTSQPPHYVFGEPVLESRAGTWAIRINDKANR